MRRIASFVFFAALVTPLSAQPPSSTRQRVQTLTSDRLDGRMTGSEGERLAGTFLSDELQRIGAKALPGAASYQSPFKFTAGASDGGSTLAVSAREKAAFSRTFDVQALSFSDDGTVTAPVVFAGYGIVVPDGHDFPYDSYAGVDVKGKVALVLRYFPEDADQKARAVLARYADLRYKAMQARQHGAAALLIVTGPRSPNAGETVPMSFDTALSGSGIVAASVSGRAAGAILSAAPGKTLEDVQKSLDSANPHVAGFELPDVTVTIHTVVARKRSTGANVLAYLPATTAPMTDKPWIAIGAHYDHLGHGANGNSLATAEERAKVHPGADDNASGTAAVLGIADALAKGPRHRNILIALWSGEELGLIGSSAFAAHPPVPLDQIESYLNFDMVGRMQDNKLTIQAIGTSPAWPKVIEQANVAAGFDLQLQTDPYQPTDVATFNQASVPCLSFFTGTHADYHRPSDTADKIDYDDLDRIVAMAAAIVRRVDALDQAPAFAKVNPPTESGASRTGARVFTGTIPDYSTAVKGLLLSGVIGGGPAEQAGLQKGDVIVEIAGQSIANIYDYTYALDVLKIGQPTKVVFMRGTERRETMLTPAARK